MNNVILYLCYNRENETKLSLSYLEKCNNISEYTLIVVRQNGSSEVAQIINSTHHLVTEFKKNSFSSINQNIHFGLSFCFNILNSESVLILEDDILVSKDILNFTFELINKYRNRTDFRSVNCFSSEKFNINNIRAYGLFNYGIGQGWCITKKTWKHLIKFWSGKENMHFDALIEPYMKTGFVCMPICSRIKNIGWGQNSSHSPQNESDEFYVKLENSWVDHSNTVESGYFLNSKIKYRWRDDCLQYNYSKIISELKLIKFFMKFYIKKILIYFRLYNF